MNIITIISSLLSGLIATIVTLIVSNIIKARSVKFDYKMKLFCQLVAYRSDMTDACESTGRFQDAINQVFIAYNKDKKVIERFEEFRKSVICDQSDKISALIMLLKEMAAVLKIDVNFANDELFTRPIITTTSR